MASPRAPTSKTPNAHVVHVISVVVPPLLKVKAEKWFTALSTMVPDLPLGVVSLKQEYGALHAFHSELSAPAASHLLILQNVPSNFSAVEVKPLMEGILKEEPSNDDHLRPKQGGRPGVWSVGFTPFSDQVLPPPGKSWEYTPTELPEAFRTSFAGGKLFVSVQRPLLPVMTHANFQAYIAAHPELELGHVLEVAPPKEPEKPKKPKEPKKPKSFKEALTDPHPSEDTGEKADAAPAEGPPHKESPTGSPKQSPPGSPPANPSSEGRASSHSGSGAEEEEHPEGSPTQAMLDAFGSASAQSGGMEEGTPKGSENPLRLPPYGTPGTPFTSMELDGAPSPDPSGAPPDPHQA